MAASIRPFEESDADQLIELWVRCGLVRPQNNPVRDIERKRSVSPSQLLVAELEEAVVGSVMFGYEGHRGWINYLAVRPELQRSGLGRSLMVSAEQELAALGCPKVNLQVRATNSGVVEFYRRIGYQVEEVVSLGKRLVTDDPYLPPRP